MKNLSFVFALFFVLLAGLAFGQPTTTPRKVPLKNGPSQQWSAQAKPQRPASLVAAKAPTSKPATLTATPAAATAPAATAPKTVSEVSAVTTATVSAPPTAPPTAATATSTASATTASKFSKVIETITKRTAITGILFIGKGIGYGATYNPDSGQGRNYFTLVYVSRSNGDGEAKSPTLFVGAARTIRLFPKVAVGFNGTAGLQPYYVPKVSKNGGGYSSYFEYDTKHHLKTGIGVHTIIMVVPNIQATVSVNTFTGVGLGVNYKF